LKETALVTTSTRSDIPENPFVILAPNPVPDPAAPVQRESSLIPKIPLQDGEQYRFHFDMSKCIGCKCCEVACAEQNNNPPEVSWRRVGEMEGGVYPNTQRLYLSMGCNHCVEPSCMTGCPTEAYSKEAVTGIVLHDANMCIGCEYCIWNCPYNVPVFNEERGVVGKCDMCHGRLVEGEKPACVNACPSEAIQIEIVNIEQWKREYRESANAPGLPSADDTISTTRVTLPGGLPLDARKADYHRVRPEKPHFSLVLMTVLTQLSVGGFVAAWLLSLFSESRAPDVAGTAALIVGLLSFGISPLHLGRPAFAFRAIRNWKRSWLSREIISLTGFGAFASGYAVLLWLGSPDVNVVGVVATALGLCGVTATSFLYMVPGRPAWRTPYTVAEFALTGVLLGPLFIAALGVAHPMLSAIAAAAAVGQLLNQVRRFVALTRSDEFEKQASARLLSQEFSKLFLFRLLLVVAGGVALPLMGGMIAGFALALAGELLGRYLFFVTVVPKNMALTFFEQAEAA
jgi:DMSO reductase iron-sulfur subunit